MAMSVSIMIRQMDRCLVVNDARGVFPGVRLVGDIILYFVRLPGVGFEVQHHAIYLLGGLMLADCTV